MLFLYHLEKEIVISTFQEPPELALLCCFVPPINIKMVEVNTILKNILKCEVLN